MLVASRITR